MRRVLCFWVLCTSILCIAQTPTQKKWEYGIHPQFIDGLIKPVSSDTFTNKASFGLGLLLERRFNSFDVQFMPAFVQTRYSNDVLNHIGTTNALDLNLAMVHSIDKGKQAHIYYGPVIGFTLQHIEQDLSGKTLRTGINNRFVTSNPVDYGFQLGLGLDLNAGTRLTVGYTDFFRGKQESGAITGRIDYLQIGIQLRFRELTSSQRLSKKHLAQEAQIKRGTDQATLLKKGNNGVLVFVLPPIKKDYAGPETPAKDSMSKLRQQENRKLLASAIQRYYTHGEYVITTDSLMSSTQGNIPAYNSKEVYNLDDSKTLFYARIDELFINANGNLKWGIFVFDSEMNILQEPFPYFTNYRNLDKQFEAATNMINEFNAALRQLAP